MMSPLSNFSEACELRWLSIGTGSKHRLIEGDFNETKHESPGMPLPEQQLSLFSEGAHQFERMEANERYQHSHQAYDGAERSGQKIMRKVPRERMKVYETQLNISARFNQPPPPVPPAIAHLLPDVVKAQQEVAAQHQAARQRNPIEKFNLAAITDKMADMEGEDDVPKIKLGDASCAAPFTSKLSHVSAVEKLSRERPLGNIFNLYVLLSVLLQFALHIVSLVYITNLTHSYETRGPIDLEAKFEPSLLNTAIYLLGLSQQVSTFAINFQGRPFREGIRENSALWWGLVGASAVAFSGATDFMPELNRWLQIVEMKDSFKFQLTSMMVIDFVGCWVIEKICKRLFADLEPKPMVTRGRERREARRRVETEHATAAVVGAAAAESLAEKKAQ
ncbi:Cation-transporting ATPase 4 [Termitomyces sp. J132]|nr:Cation-transporting ATPase 4 [Termitomyces sp. J132]